MAERPVALPPVTGGEANASDTTDTSNSRPRTGLPKLFDDDGVDENQSRQARIRDAHLLLPKVRQHGNQGFQSPVAGRLKTGIGPFHPHWSLLNLGLAL